MVKGKDYMARLERAARWRLPRQEAEEIVADYRDIVADPELLQGLGSPRDVIRPLTQPRPYRIWLAVFAALCACILIPGINIIGFFPNLARLCFALDTWSAWDWAPLMHLGPVLAALGCVGTVVWFRRDGLKGEKLPRAVIVLLAVLGLWTAALLAVDFCWIRDPQGFAGMWGWGRLHYFGLTYGPLDYQASRTLDLLLTATQYGGGVLLLVGISALVKARIGDRRWAAVYVLSAAALIVTLETFILLCVQDPRPGGVPIVQWSSLAYFSIVALAGAAGTGVALC